MRKSADEFVRARDRMIDIQLKIVSCVLLESVLARTPVVYEVKTFWCKPVKLFGDKYGTTESVSLPGLSVSDYLAKVQDGENLTICVEVSVLDSGDSPLTKRKRIITSDGNALVGVALLHINEVLKKPYLSPLWQELSIVNLVEGTMEGSIYVTLEAQIPNSPGVALNKNKMSSYFSSSASSNPALFCPSHLIDKVGGIVTRDTDAQVSSTQRDMEVVQGGNAVSQTAVDSDEFSVLLQTVSATPSTPKVHPMIAHNTCTSPEFPFQIPAVEKVEKRLRFEQLSGMNGEATLTDVSIVGSPAMFGYTPFMKKTAMAPESSQDDLGGSVEDLIELLGKIPEKRGTNNPGPSRATEQKHEKLESKSRTPKHAKSEPKPSNPATPGKKPCVQPTKPKEWSFPKRQIKDRDRKDRISTLIYEPSRTPLSPKQSASKAQQKNSVPGLTIKPYKPPSPSEEENAQVFNTTPAKRRIAANIFSDND